MHRRAALLTLSALVVTGCASSDAASPSPATVRVGSLPGEISPPTTAPRSTTTTTTDPESTAPASSVAPDPLGPIGAQVRGNRVIVIGDSILASIGNRYGNQLCTDLVPRRWAVEVDAEVGRHIGFGREVLAARGDAKWDAAVVMLGNNHDGDATAFTAELEQLLDQLGSIPVVLLTLTPYRPQQDAVNDAIRAAAGTRQNVRLVEWAAPTAGEEGRPLLDGDRLHLSEDGKVALAGMIGDQLGPARQGLRGACLRSTFTDDTPHSIPGTSEPGSG